MKNEVRKNTLAARRRLSAAERVQFSAEIAARLFETAEYKAAEHIMCYADYNCEVSTDIICERITADKKQLYLPRCEVDTKRLEVCKVNALSDTKIGAYGIREPLGDGVDAHILQLVIVPMAAFDRNMGRMGYGGGYYDRFLADLQAVRCGIAFGVQEVGRAAFEATDAGMDMIITEREIIYKE